MNFPVNNPMQCSEAREEFGAYLDGVMTGAEMASIAAHLASCATCAHEFAELRMLQQRLGELGHAVPPAHLQPQLHAALATERERASHLNFLRRMLLQWESTVAPVALRLAGGFAVAIVLAAGLGYLFGAPIAVQANDESLSHLAAPEYLYSYVPAEAIETRHDVPIVVEAKVDTTGRVYDYAILEGPTDTAVQAKVEQNLLASVFKPATVFGVPVRGNVVLTYTGISVKG